MMKILLSTVAVIALFLGWSAATSFSSWPWTTSREVRAGPVLGFEIGQTKPVAFANAIAQQKGAAIAGLRLLDAPSASYDDKFKGLDLEPSDLPRVLPSDSWYVPISHRNAWLELTFEGGRISRIVEKTYRGPTV